LTAPMESQLGNLSVKPKRNFILKSIKIFIIGDIFSLKIK
jgi:hypothetical protein